MSAPERIEHEHEHEHVYEHVYEQPTR